MRTRDYRIRLPKDTTVRAACNQVHCASWLHGWDVVLDEREPAKRAAAEWIRSGRSGRTFRELPGGGDVTVFRFDARQRCFEEHRTKPARFTAGGQPRADMAEWIDDLDNHVGQLADQLRKG